MEYVHRISTKGVLVMAEDRELEVRGMTCVGCENRITGALSDLAGVVSASAEHETGRVVVSVEPPVASDTEMRSAIEGLGYRVVT